MNDLVFEPNLAVVGHDRACQHLDERGLARSIVADHAKDLARVKIEVRIVERDHVAITLGEAAGRKNWPEFAHWEALRSHWSIATATMTRTPTVKTCQ